MDKPIIDIHKLLNQQKNAWDLYNKICEQKERDLEDEKNLAEAEKTLVEAFRKLSGKDRQKIADALTLQRLKNIGK